MRTSLVYNIYWGDSDYFGDATFYFKLRLRLLSLVYQCLVL